VSAESLDAARRSVDLARALVEASGSGPCALLRTGAPRCLDTQSSVRWGFAKKDPKRMCDACAGYWHATMALDSLTRNLVWEEREELEREQNGSVRS
jgi:transposase